VLKEFTAEEIKSAFKTWVEAQDLNDPKNLSFLPGKFVQIVDNLAYTAREQKREAEEAKTQRDAAVAKMQQQAEAERAEAEKKREAETKVFDPLADLLSETDQTVV
jgi:regulator of protease activity HflC (stomatin/prohibitin superfamily)